MAKLFALGATITIATLIVTHKFPGTTEGARTFAAYQDNKNLERAQRETVEIIRPFPCDRSNADTLTFFGRNGVDGKPVPLLYYDYDQNGRLVCFRNPGFNPKTGKEVRAVTPDIVDAIEAQAPPSVPPPPTVVVQTSPPPYDDEPPWSPYTRPGHAQ
jgi:hypothetical protein